MAEVRDNILSIRSVPPYIRSGDSISRIMWTFITVLILPCIYSVYLFGFHAALILAACVISAVLSGTFFRLLLKREVRIFNGASVITGLLVGMNVPPDIPVWIPVTGTVFAVIIVRELYGGTGHNIFNPALAGRAFMMASWPIYMTSFRHITIPGNGLAVSETIPKELFDVITQATPLTVMKEGTRIAGELNIPFETIYNSLMNKSMIKALVAGNTGGCIGETSALLLLAGALILLWRKIITWHIPVTFIGTVALAFYIYYSLIGSSYPGYITLIHVLSGGLIMGAFFMATDMVTSPLSGRGKLIFGMGCGIITFIIRLKGGYVEGVCYAILIMNAVVPLIDRFLKPAVFGYSRDITDQQVQASK